MPKGKMPPVPEVSQTLLDYLNYKYTNNLTNVTSANLDRAQGCREVVDHLEAIKRKTDGLIST